MITTLEIKQMGFGSEIMGYDDSEKDGNDMTALDRYISGFISFGKKRLRKMGIEVETISLEDENFSVIKQALLNLVLVGMLPIVWAKDSVGESSVEIYENVKITMKNISATEKELILKTLLKNVDLALSDILPHSKYLQVIGDRS